MQEVIDTGLNGDLMAIDIRQALYYFGEITGEITNDDLLGNIFANFCIGKVGKTKPSLSGLIYWI